jgi:hypothetical protein
MRIRRESIPEAGGWLGFVLVVLGVSFFDWRAGLISAGAILITVVLLGALK